MLPVKRAIEQSPEVIQKQKELIREVELRYGTDPEVVLEHLNREGGREAMLDYINSKADEAVRSQILGDLEGVIILFKVYGDRYLDPEVKEFFNSIPCEQQ